MAPGVRPRVPVIDDEPNVRAFVCDLLEGLGYEADDAEDGRQGLALLERDRYDLVITDLQVPNVNGWDVVTAVRGRLPTIPIIVISGFAIEDDTRQAGQVGVPLLQKPFSVAELQQVIRQALSGDTSQPEPRPEAVVPKGSGTHPRTRKLAGTRNKVRDNSGSCLAIADSCSPRR